MPTPPPQLRPIITETTEAAAVLDRLMMACVTGKNAETVLGPGGLGAFTEHKLWTEAAEGIAASMPCTGTRSAEVSGFGNVTAMPAPSQARISWLS